MPDLLGAEYGNNLRYFLKHGVAAGDGVTYLIIIQKARTDRSCLGAAFTAEHWALRCAARALQMTDEPQLEILPKLPPNAQYIWRRNSCFDWCASI